MYQKWAPVLKFIVIKLSIQTTCFYKIIQSLTQSRKVKKFCWLWVLENWTQNKRSEILWVTTVTVQDAKRRLSIFIKFCRTFNGCLHTWTGASPIISQMLSEYQTAIRESITLEYLYVISAKIVFIMIYVGTVIGCKHLRVRFVL